MRQIRSKLWDMKLHWLKDKENEKEFRVYWAPGPENKADFCTKHHPPAHFRHMRPHYVHNIMHKRYVQRLTRNNLRQLVTKIVTKKGIARVC